MGCPDPDRGRSCLRLWFECHRVGCENRGNTADWFGCGLPTAWIARREVTASHMAKAGVPIGLFGIGVILLGARVYLCIL